MVNVPVLEMRALSLVIFMMSNQSWTQMSDPGILTPETMFVTCRYILQ